MAKTSALALVSIFCRSPGAALELLRRLFGQSTVYLRSLHRDEIVDFATQYDPQVFHVDESHALTEELGGVMASGWHTTAIFMRLAVDAYLGNAAVLTSPGVDELRWLAPVRVGDVISGEAIVEQARLSASKPDRGILTTGVRLWKQRNIEVLRMTTHAFVRVRPQR
jgi:acyl dehydratase